MRRIMHLNTLLVFCSFVNLAACYTFYGRKNYQFKVKNCEYKGYKPGGNVKDVSQIKAPVAELANKGIKGVLGKLETIGTFAHRALPFFKKLGQIAPALGPAAGAFSFGMGLIKSFTEIKPEDIVSATNAAIGDLTSDVNSKLEQMKGYVDTKVISLQKRIMENSYKKSFILWKNCIEEKIEFQTECQQNAFRHIDAAYDEFAIFSDELSKNEELSRYKSRELEAYLISFRDYANLVLTMLKPLVDIFEKEGVRGEFDYKRYKRYLRERATKFISYAEKAVDAIKKSHSTSPCFTTVKCGGWHDLWEGGWFKAKTGKYRTCTCVVDDGTKQECQARNLLRVDGKKAWDSFNLPCKAKDIDCASTKMAKEQFEKKVEAYETQDEKIVSAYWKKEILDTIPLWEDFKALGGTDQMQDSMDDEPEIVETGELYRNEARLRRAEDELLRK